jgi:hypothetical protein
LHPRSKKTKRLGSLDFRLGSPDFRVDDSDDDYLLNWSDTPELDATTRRHLGIEDDVDDDMFFADCMALSCVPNPFHFESVAALDGVDSAHYDEVSRLTKDVRTVPAFPTTWMKRPTLEPTERMRKALRRAELDVARGVYLDPEGNRSDDSELEELYASEFGDNVKK